MTGPKVQPRLPFDRLARLVALSRDLPLVPRSGRRGPQVASHGDYCGDATLADVLKVHRRQIQTWWRYGMTVRHADRAAITLGLHPELVWGDLWVEACAQLWPEDSETGEDGQSEHTEACA